MRTPLSIENPALCAQWSDRNLPLTPDMVTAGSSKKVWWHGACGHSFVARISDRVKGSGCPFCYAERIQLKKAERIRSLAEEKKQASWIKSMRLTKREKGRIDREFPERVYYVVKAGLRLLQNDEEKIGIPIQYYFPDISGAIELNSKKRSYDTVREICENRLCAKNNIRLVRIIDPECEANDECYCLYREDRSLSSLEWAIRSAFSILGVNADVDLKRDYRMILS